MLRLFQPWTSVNPLLNQDTVTSFPPTHRMWDRWQRTYVTMATFTRATRGVSAMWSKRTPCTLLYGPVNPQLVNVGAFWFLVHLAEIQHVILVLHEIRSEARIQLHLVVSIMHFSTCSLAWILICVLKFICPCHFSIRFYLFSAANETACRIMPRLPNGYVYFRSGPANQTNKHLQYAQCLEFSCKAGFMLKGLNRVCCGLSGRLTNDMPECIGGELVCVIFNVWWSVMVLYI